MEKRVRKQLPFREVLSAETEEISTVRSRYRITTDKDTAGWRKLGRVL
jgi:hypothetical protein